MTPDDASPGENGPCPNSEDAPESSPDDGIGSWPDSDPADSVDYSDCLVRPSYESLVRLDRLIPAKLNDTIYKPVLESDPGMDELAESIRREGLKQPIVATRDLVVISGHRRRVACRMAGVDPVPVRFEPILSDDPEFPTLLVTYNLGQRDKTAEERVREQIAVAAFDEDEAYEDLVSHRAKEARTKATPLALGHRNRRAAISRGKRLLLEAVRKVIDDLADYWPLSDRRIHYALLNDPPLVHASKPDSTYRNDVKSYKALTELLTRARLSDDPEHNIPFEAIGDETRPITTWNVDPNVGPFVKREAEGFLRGYRRDLLKDQPNHIEVVAEKLTVQGTARPVAEDFCLPLTVGRGYSSLPPRKDMYDRFQKSGKQKLVILFLADHDPEGMDIPVSFAKSMRDDFGIGEVELHRVGLNIDQVRRLNLPSNTAAKPTSSRFRKYQKTYGSSAYELEAAPPDQLARWLREAIQGVLDVRKFNGQVAAERQDAVVLKGYRAAAGEFLGSLITDTKA